MKKSILLALAIIATLNLSAQKQGTKTASNKNTKQATEWYVQKQAQRKAYVLGKMELTETDRAAFEVIFDDYRKEFTKSRNTMKAARRQMNDSCSNEQYIKCLDIVNNEKNLQTKLKAEFYQEMKKMLSGRQIYLYYKADREFNKLLMREIQQRKAKSKK